jgi:hypothetical protein
MPGGRAKSPSGESAAQRIAIAAAALTVTVFLVWSAIRIHGLLAVLYQNSDNASAPVLAEFLGERGSGLVTLGYYPWLEPLYALHLTRWLPDHRVAWEILPFVVYGGVVGLVGWMVRRTVSTAAGAAVALAMAAPAPLVIRFLGVPNMRLFTLAHAVILGAFLVTLPGIEGWGAIRRAVWIVALAVILAVGASSDPLVLIGGAAPFALAVICGWALGLLRRASAVSALAAVAAGAAGGRLLERIAENSGIVYDERNLGLTSVHDMLSNLGLLFQDVALLAHGRIEQGGALGTALAVIAWAVFISLPIVLLGGLARLRTTLRDGDRPRAQRLLLIYWGISAGAVAIAFVVSSAPEDISAVRYMTILWPALLTVIVIRWPRRGTAAVAVVATLCALIGWWELAEDQYAAGDPRAPQGTEVSGLERFVRERGLDHGYASYWDAASLTDLTKFRARTYPIQDCAAGRCAWPFHTMEVWYRPKQGVRTYYLTNDTGLPDEVGPPPARWGRPIERVRIGHLTVYVYDFDLATKLGPSQS